MRTMKRIAAATVVVSALTMTAACGGGDSSDSASGKASSAAPAPEESSMAADPETEAAADPAADLVGKGCAGYAEQDNIDTWRQWVWMWEAKSGNHTIEVRATDDTGYTQTEKRVSIAPNGSTGWHSVNVTAG